MNLGKRQLVLATLVVALGAAVYLNWQFSDDRLLVTDTLNSEKELGTAQLVSGSLTQPEEGAETSAAAEPEQEAVAANAEVSAYFTEARLSRQKARDSAVELLEEVLESVESDEEARKEALEKAAALAENVVQESNIENLIKAKGFSDCVVFLENGECSVVVQTDGLLPNEAIAIKDIIGGQSGVAYDKIKIVEAK